MPVAPPNLWQPKTSLYLVRGPLRDKISPVENHWLKALNYCSDLPPIILFLIYSALVKNGFFVLPLTIMYLSESLCTCSYLYLVQTSLRYLFSCSLLRASIPDLLKGHRILLPVIILSQHHLTLHALVCPLNVSNLRLQCKLPGQRLWWFYALLCHHDLEECIVHSSWLIDSCFQRMKECINIWLLEELAGRHRTEKARHVWDNEGAGLTGMKSRPWSWAWLGVNKLQRLLKPRKGTSSITSETGESQSRFMSGEWQCRGGVEMRNLCPSRKQCSGNLDPIRK